MGRYIPDPTAAGVLARGGSIKGRCQTGECRRHVEMDLETWVAHGFGHAPLRDLQRLYLCGKVDCGFKFNPEYFARGAPLQFYAHDEEASITVSCQGCKRGRRFTAPAFLDQIIRAGSGDGNTPIHELDGLVRGACPGCGRRQWKAAFVMKQAPP